MRFRPGLEPMTLYYQTATIPMELSIKNITFVCTKRMTNSRCSEIIVQKENQKVHEFLDQCAGHCLNAIVKDKNVDCFL